MRHYTLPEDFFFGAAMSGPQTEGAWRIGGKLENMWDTWSNESIDAFHNRVGSYVGNDFMARYRGDLDIMADLGLTSFRTSIQWSRLLDANGELNPQGAAWYHRLFAAAADRGLEVFVNLYHFDMPTYLFRRGGWESREVVEAYARYAQIAFREFGDEIRTWFTFNEPIVEPEQRYMTGVWYPQLHDFSRSLTVRYNISIAHCLATERFRQAQAKGEMRDDARIGLINCFSPSYTKDDPSEADLEAVRMNDGLNNRWWLDIVRDGTLPADVIETLEQRGQRLPHRPGDAQILQLGPVDWLGCNYYQPSRVQAPDAPTDSYGNPRFADAYVWPEARMNTSRGWEIYPKGIYDFGMKCKRDYPGLEFFISENGIGIEGEGRERGGDGRIEDSYRVEFVRDHLAWIARAIDEGAACRGYHYWALIDNWSWANAFKNRYGFIEVDLTQGYARRAKRSADWLKEVVATHIVR
ncbi:aryl-phospho-beta-glucosidase [Coriobacterium glomerans PW2]|uniref:Aryl-phospho-beta-glucosidase n=1 Tax=Coriobacterium glomerans (strain ATCC 49209 / DSM 20642 / JCM 10262 / PW2) TaxID=700015 RepID=F2N8X9_CORGP|nr:glycoside hydrolase family 1 protein [Coriobacterium glomerans]AEB07579.1 aryl-phospho-beta-glucosidase [Coriobacterium glomerans PW2]